MDIGLNLNRFGHYVFLKVKWTLATEQETIFHYELGLGLCCYKDANNIFIKKMQIVKWISQLYNMFISKSVKLSCLVCIIVQLLVYNTQV
jgi:hypothetical protein